MAAPANDGIGEVGGGGNVNDGEEVPLPVGVQPETAGDEGGDDVAVGQGQGHEARVVPAEELHLLTLFPEEVWLRIFDNLREEPQTLLNCMEASPLFRRLLKPTQPIWMFGMIFPHVVDHLTRNQILACRRTGRDWNKAVDNYLQENRKLRPFNEANFRAAEIGEDEGEGFSSRMYGEGPHYHSFGRTVKLINFMESVGGTTPGRNPFIDRSVAIFGYFLGRGDAPLTFWSTVFQFLDKFGKHIWYFRLGAGQECRDARNVNSRLLYLVRGCLTRLPNIRRFRLYVNLNLDHTAAPNMRDSSENVEDDALAAYLGRRPLPLIPSLENLYLDVSSEGPVTICEHLVALHQNQLKMIRFDRLNHLTMEGELSTLTEFHWSPLTANLDDVENVFVHLNSSPLGRLILRIHSEEDTIDLGRLFGLISNRFGNSLRMLELGIWLEPLVEMAMDLDHPGQLEVNATARLGMPHLEALELTGNCFQQLRIDFLLDVASSLRYLNLRHMAGAQRVARDQEEELDIYEYMREDRLYESNVWIKMPKLKRLGVRFGFVEEDRYNRFYNRETYEFLEGGGQLEN